GVRQGQGLPAMLALPDRVLVAETVAESGWLALAVTDRAPPDTVAAIQTGLGVAAELVALHLRLRTQAQDLADEALRADIGEMAGPLIHEVANLLNNLLLTLTLLEEGAEDASAINVSKIRGRAEQVTGLIKEIQDYRRKRVSEGGAANVNRIVQQAVELLRDYR